MKRNSSIILISICTTFSVLAYSQMPDWWSQRGVLNAETANDFAAVNQGQLKHIATEAYNELSENLPGGAGTEVGALVQSWGSPSQETDDYLAVNLGQLKNVAKPFYDRLIEIGYVDQYPWEANPEDPDDYALANIGQVKNLFAFDVTYSSDDDPLPDWWQLHHFGTLQYDADDDPMETGLTNLQHYHLGSDPNLQFSPILVETGVSSGHSIEITTVAQAMGYYMWILQFDLSISQLGMANTPAGDGITNLEKYAFGLDPTEQGHPFMWMEIVEHPDTELDHGSRRFTRNLDAVGVEITFKVATELDPPDWEVVDEEDWTVITNWVDEEEGLEEIWLLDPDPVDAHQSRFYWIDIGIPEFDEGLRGYWPVFEMTGEMLFDHSENLNHGDISATGAHWPEDGKGLVLDGNGEITVGNPDNESLDLDNDSLTLAAWFKTGASGKQTLFSKGAHNYNDGYAIGLNGDGEVYAILGGVNHLHIETLEEFDDESWHLAVAVFDRVADEARIYVDGQLRDINGNNGSGAVIDGNTLDFSGVSGLSGSSDRDFYIGAMADQNTNDPIDRFSGRLADVRIYDRELSAEEVGNLEVINGFAIEAPGRR